MNNFRRGLDKGLELLCSALLVFMTLAAAWQVISRYVLSKPSTATEELTLISFVWMALFAAAYVFGKKEHMRMSFILDRFNENSKMKFSIVAEVVTLLFALLVLVFGGIKICGLSMSQTSASLKIPMGYIYFALPLSGIITAIYNVLNIIELKGELSLDKDKIKYKDSEKNFVAGGKI